eukprot:gene7271-8082_t
MADNHKVSNNGVSSVEQDMKLDILSDDESETTLSVAGPSAIEETVTEKNPLMEAQAMEDVEIEHTDRSSCWKSKYNWRRLLPFACCCKSSKLTKLENAGFFEFFLITWASDIITAGFKKALKLPDLGRLSKNEQSCVNYNKFVRCCNEERDRQKTDNVPVGKILFRIVRTNYILAVIYLLISLLLQLFTAGFLLKKLLSFIEEPSGNVWIGMIWVFLLLIAQFGISLLSSGLFTVMIRAGIAARAAVLSVIYNKVSRLKNVGSKSVGELVNMCANDAQRVFECCQFGAFLIGAPFLVIIVSVYLFLAFGPSSLIGVVVLILFLPLQALLGKVISKLRGKVILITDKRVKMINELLTCIKLIKMYAWECSFSKEIFRLRAQEKKYMAQILYVQAINMSMATLLTVIAPVATFSVHVALGNNLTVAEAFTVIVMFNIFPRTLVLLPFSVRGISEAMNSIKRLKNLLDLEEYVPHEDEPEDENIALIMEHCCFSWPTLIAESEAKDSNNTENGHSKLSDTEEKSDNEAPILIKNSEVKIKQPKDEKKRKGKSKSPSEPLNFQLSPTLFHINMTVKKGSLIGVCGGVGSGKSSLLQAILSQMHSDAGKVQVIKSKAYVSQQAWIMHDTIRNNITFRKEFKENEYKMACQASCLQPDLDSFENGDLTEIGERGLNLSGGQKQRVSLARALYANADLYLLDDPLSAVDAHVGQHIFQHCIQEFLKDKTVIFVTHQLQYLKDCDEVICMLNGRIEEHGTFDELMDNGQEFSQLIRQFRQEHENNSLTNSSAMNGDPATPEGHDANDIVADFNAIAIERQDSLVSSANDGLELDIGDADEISVEVSDAKKIEKGKIVKEEESATGSVSWRVYKLFCKAGGGYCAALATVLSQLTVLAAIFFVEWWLSKWLQEASKPVYINNSTVPTTVSLSENPDLPFFLTVYTATGCSMFVFQLVSSMFYVGFFITAATSLHKRALMAIVKCPMKFFDTTPIGRILNRFSRDQDDLDNRLPFACESLAKNGGRIFISLVFIAVIFPWFLVAILPLSVLFVLLNKVFRRTNRELKRLDNTTRSPMFSHVATTVQGLTTLHAYGKMDDFRKQFYLFIDQNSLPMFLFFTGNQWLRIRLDSLCILIATITSIIAIFTKGQVPAAFAGLAITYSMRMTGLFQFVCRLAAEAEARFTSAERMTNYAYELEAEDQNQEKHEIAPTEWPQSGQIEFDNTELRYRPGLPLVLKGISFTVKCREKIGVAGRTGAGKSSLAVALFRLAELDGGRILIDGIDSSKIDVQTLRSKLSVIPQDPVLFIGTLRHNLDPFGKYSDDELWSALEKAHMKDAVASMPQKLESLVAENGENFSVGERQLICMGRALLRGSKILLLDEATAAIDTQTDAKIQDTIRDSFRDCTVLTIAHRLNTIVECDRVMVLDEGNLVEFDTPSNLIQNPKSRFSTMLKLQKSHIGKN